MTNSEINDFLGIQAWLVTPDKRIIEVTIGSRFNDVVFVKTDRGFADWAKPNVNLFKSRAEAELVVAMRGISA